MATGNAGSKIKVFQNEAVYASTSLIPWTMRAESGMQNCSIAGLYGIGTSRAQTRLGAAFNEPKVAGSSVIIAAISAAALPVIEASSTMTTRPL